MQIIDKKEFGIQKIIGQTFTSLVAGEFRGFSTIKNFEIEYKEKKLIRFVIQHASKIFIVVVAAERELYHNNTLFSNPSNCIM